MVSATATVLLICPQENSFLVGIRHRDADTYPLLPCLPGGFLNAKTADFPGETLEQTAVREVFEETGLDISRKHLNLFWVCSDPTTDPRSHVINACFYTLIIPEEMAQAKAGDDLEEIRVWNYDKVSLYFNNEVVIPHDDLAFNHREIVSRGLQNYAGINRG
jgi:8-oxo-dGTP diphosphatase